MIPRDKKLNAINSFSGTFMEFIDRLKAGDNICVKKKVFNDLTSCPLYAAYQTLSKIKSIVILIHSPQGCATSMWFLCGGALSLKASLDGSSKDRAVTLTTAVGNNCIINGSDDLLYNALKDIEKRYNPKFTVVLTTCFSNIIGASVKEVIAKVSQENPNFHVGWLDTAGCKSWYWSNGYDLVLDFFVNKIMPTPEIVIRDEKAVNVITFGNATSIDAQECTRLLRAIGLTPHIPLNIPYASIEDIQKSASTSLNVLMCKAYGQVWSESMRVKYGTPFVDASHPISLYFTRKWLLEMARHFDLEPAALVLIDNEEKSITKELENIKAKLRGKKVAIAAGHDKIASLLMLAIEFEMEIVYAGILTYDDSSKNKLIEVSEHIRGDFCCYVNPQSHEESAVLSALKPDLYVGPAGQTPRVALMNIPTVSCHFNDFIGTYFGFRGVINYGNQMIAAMSNTNAFIAPDNFLFDGAEKICGREWMRECIRPQS